VTAGSGGVGQLGDFLRGWPDWAIKEKVECHLAPLSIAHQANRWVTPLIRDQAGIENSLYEILDRLSRKVQIEPVLYAVLGFKEPDGGLLCKFIDVRHVWVSLYVQAWTGTYLKFGGR
jgi:hypothetical protein